jgi:lipopolysaccharide/colanic/teichoic acid biosynthesis glycosyltransferase
MHLDPRMLERVRKGQDYQRPQVNRLDIRVPLYREVHPWQRVVKRSVDIVGSIFGLACFVVILPVLAVAIRINSRGPVFYGQVRVGINRRTHDGHGMAFATMPPGHNGSRPDRDRRKVVQEGHAFTIHKLRTMYEDSESDGVRWAEKGDPRITRVGHFLRRTRLDELPQFWNVLKGDMSLVGPRPERPPFITLLSSQVPGYLDRLRFKPGITGLAQVEAGYDETLESVHRKVALDLEYIARFSLALDLKILLRSVGVVITGRGAF